MNEDTKTPEAAVTLASDTCKRFKVKKVFDLSPNTEAKPLAGLADLLVSNNCDTKGVFARPGHVMIVLQRSAGDAATADVLSLGPGTAALRLRKNGNIMMPACSDAQRRPGRVPPENALLVSDTEPDASVPCLIGGQPIGLSCPVCPLFLGDELQERLCTAPTGSATCVRGTLSILDDVSPGGIETSARRVNFIMRSHCACDFLSKDVGYAVLLSDRPIPKTARTVHLDGSFTLATLPTGVTNLTSCASGAPDEDDVMLGDQPLAAGHRPPLAAPATPLPQSCPVCHSEMTSDLYNPICAARIGPSGTYIGKTRVVQSVRGAHDKIGHTLIYTMPQNCKCDYVAKPSRQYFVFMEQLASAEGKSTHVPFTEQMHILAYSYRNARLLHDALSACPSTASASFASIQKRIDTYAEADQAEYVGSYGGASGPLYGSVADATHHAEPKIFAGYGTYDGGRSASMGHGAPSYGAAPSMPSYGSAASTYGAGSAHGPAPAPAYAVPTATSTYGAQPPAPPPAYGVTSLPSYGYAQSPTNYNTASASYGASAVTAGYPAPSPSYGGGSPNPSYASAMSSPSYDAANAAHVAAPSYGAPQGSTHGSGYGSATVAPDYGSATVVPGYGGGSSHGSNYGAASYSGGANAAPSYAARAPAVYMPIAPSYGPSPAPAYNGVPDPGHGAQAQPSSYGSAPQPAHNSGSAPSYGTLSPYSQEPAAPAQSTNYGATGHESAWASMHSQGGAPSYGSHSYGSAVAASYGAHLPAASSYGPSSYKAAQQKAPAYASPAQAYMSPSFANYGSVVPASNSAAPSPSYKSAPAYAPAPKAGYPQPAASYSKGALPAHGANGPGYRPPAAAYGQASSPTYKPPAYSGGTHAASDVSSYDGYGDVTYAPPHGMAQYPPAAYESLYPTEDDYATVISYVPTYPSDDGYYAGSQDSYGNKGHGSNDVTYSAPPYAAPAYGIPTNSPPAYAGAPSPYGANAGYYPSYSGGASALPYAPVSHGAGGGSYSANPHSAGDAGAPYKSASAGSSPYFPPKYPPAPYPPAASPDRPYLPASPSPTSYGQNPAPAYKVPASPVSSYTAAPAAPTYMAYGQVAHKIPAGSKPSYINAPAPPAAYVPPSHPAPSYGPAAAVQSTAYVTAGYDQPPYDSSSYTATASAPAYAAPKPYVVQPPYTSAPAPSSGNSYSPIAYATTAGYSGPGGHDASYGMAPSYRSPGKAYEHSQGRNPTYNGEPSPPYGAPAYGTGEAQQSSYDSASSQTYTTSSYGPVSYTTQGSSAASYSATYAPAAHNAPAYPQPPSYAPAKTEAAASSGPAEYSGATYTPPSSYSSPSHSASSAPPSYPAPSYGASNAVPSSASQAYNPSYGAAGAAMPTYASLPTAPAVVSSGGKLYGPTMPPSAYQVASYAPPAYVAPSYVQPSYAATYAPPAYVAPAYHAATAAPPTYSHPSYMPSYAPPVYSAPAYEPMLAYGSAPHKPLHSGKAYLTVTHAPAAYVPGPYGQPPYTPPAYSAHVYAPNVQPTYAAPAYPVPSYADQAYPLQSVAQYIPHSHNQPHYGGATYAPPAYAASAYEASYAPPTYSAPSYAHPSYSMPANLASYAPPAYSAPQYPQPAYSKDVYGVSYAPSPYSAPSYSKPAYTHPSYGVPSPPMTYNAPAAAAPAYSQPAQPNMAAHMVAAQHVPSYGVYGSPAAGPVKYPAGHHAAPAYSANAGHNVAMYGKPTYPRYPQQVVTLAYTLPAQSLPSYYSPPYGKPSYDAPGIASANAYGPPKPIYGPAPQQTPAHSMTYAPAGPQGVNSYGQPSAYGSGTSAPPSYSVPPSYAPAAAVGVSGGNGAYGPSAGAPSYNSGSGGDGSYGQGASQGGAYTTSSYTASAPTYESAYTTYSPSAQSQYTTYATPSGSPPSYTTYGPASQPSYTTYGYSPSTYTTNSASYNQHSYTTYGTPPPYSPAPAATQSPAYPDYSDPGYGSSGNNGPASYGVTYAPAASSAPSYPPPSYYPPASYAAPADYTTASYSAATHAPQGYVSPSYSPPTYSAPSYGEPSHAPQGYSAPPAGYPMATHAPAVYSAPSHAPPPYPAHLHADPSYGAVSYVGATDAPAGYSAITQMPPAYSAGVYVGATHAPAAQPPAAYSPTLANYRAVPPAADYPPPPLVQPAYGRSVHPEAVTRYAPAKPIEPEYSEAFPIGLADVPSYKPRCPQASHTCPICPPVLDKELLKHICNYDLIAEAEVSYPPQAGTSYGGLCSEMCIGEVLRGPTSVMDKIRFSINKYCSCDTASKEYGKVMVISNRHSWHAHGGSYGELILDDKTVLLPASKATLKAVTEALKHCSRPRYTGPLAYADAAYVGPAGCPDPFDESCPHCAGAVGAEGLATDLCNSEYASIVAVGLDYKKMAVYKNGRFAWKQAYLPDIQVDELPGYSLLVVDKQSKLSDGVLQIGSGAKLYALPYGMQTLPACSAESEAKNSRSDPGPETKLPLPEIEISVEDGEIDVEPCPENVQTTCPICIDASEEPAATATQYCKSEYAAVVSIPDDAFTAGTDDLAKSRYLFPQTDRTVGHADQSRKCRSGKLHVKQQITPDLQGVSMDAIKFTIMSSCNCSFLEQPTQFAVLASKLAPIIDEPLHLNDDVTLIGLPLGKTELPKCVRSSLPKGPSGRCGDHDRSGHAATQPREHSPCEG
ncbi:hypothetical protein HPB50_022837 [Hyalomma asiaticum]|uniref:Uncharacterized protein n=1 Tax=Hyalomma asiaticum TaxID=266040 RepID=A0ACB7T137_HYAAI|nr:hypothetical protein HPB50_022837 [Hyalomma asiaticum]